MLFRSLGEADYGDTDSEVEAAVLDADDGGGSGGGDVASEDGGSCGGAWNAAKVAVQSSDAEDEEEDEGAAGANVGGSTDAKPLRKQLREIARWVRGAAGVKALTLGTPLTLPAAEGAPLAPAMRITVDVALVLPVVAKLLGASLKTLVLERCTYAGLADGRGEGGFGGALRALAGFKRLEELQLIFEGGEAEVEVDSGRRRRVAFGVTEPRLRALLAPLAASRRRPLRRVVIGLPWRGRGAAAVSEAEVAALASEHPGLEIQFY